MSEQSYTTFTDKIGENIIGNDGCDNESKAIISSNTNNDLPKNLPSNSSTKIDKIMESINQVQDGIKKEISTELLTSSKDGNLFNDDSATFCSGSVKDEPETPKEVESMAITVTIGELEKSINTQVLSPNNSSSSNIIIKPNTNDNIIDEQECHKETLHNCSTKIDKMTESIDQVEVCIKKEISEILTSGVDHIGDEIVTFCKNSVKDEPEALKEVESIALTMTIGNIEKNISTQVSLPNNSSSSDIINKLNTKDNSSNEQECHEKTLKNSSTSNVNVKKGDLSKDLLLKFNENSTNDTLSAAKVDDDLNHNKDNSNVSKVKEEVIETANNSQEIVFKFDDTLEKNDASEITKAVGSIEPTLSTENVNKSFEGSTCNETIIKFEKKMDDEETKVSNQCISYAMDPDASDEIPEVTDSLGLLAESSRSLDYEDQEDDEDADGDGDVDGDGDDEYYEDQDDESNQMTTEQSEDSSAPHSETDIPKLKVEANAENAMESLSGNSCEFEINATKSIEISIHDNVEVENNSRESDVSVSIGVQDVQNNKQNILEESNKSAEILMEYQVNEKKIENNDETCAQQTAEMDTIKRSDASDNVESKDQSSILLTLLREGSRSKTRSCQMPLSESIKDGQNKVKKLEISQPKNVLNFVDLESSSDDDIKENKTTTTSIEIKDTSEIIKKEDVTSVSLVDDNDTESKSPLDSSEAVVEDESISKTLQGAGKNSNKAITDRHILDLEVFNLDSDDDGNEIKKKDQIMSPPKKLSAVELQKFRDGNNCINYMCPSANRTDVFYSPAPLFVLSYFEVKRKKRSNNYVCQVCLTKVSLRMKGLLTGVREMRPLMNLDMEKQCQELVEISDSDSDSENEDTFIDNVKSVTDKDITYLENMNLGDIINETWEKYNFDARLNDAKDDLDEQLKQIEKESLEIDGLFDECQVLTDKLRDDLYATFAQRKVEIDAIDIIDPNQLTRAAQSKPFFAAPSDSECSEVETQQSKRMRKSGLGDVIQEPIPLGFPSVDNRQAADSSNTLSDKVEDDVSVVRLTAEAAPADLPPPGELVRPLPRVADAVYAVRNANSSWLQARVVEWMLRDVSGTNITPGTFLKIRFDNKVKCKGPQSRIVTAKQLAYAEPANVRLTIGTRVIARFKYTATESKRNSFYSGIVSEIPNPVNNYRYLIFFDDGYAQYVSHCDTHVVVESSPCVWEDVHPDSREFVKNYLLSYPGRPMVRLHAGQSLKTEWNGKWWTSRVLEVDASLAKVHFESDDRTEWIYRGSTRLLPLFLELQAAERHRPRGLTRTNKPARSLRQDMPYVEYTRTDEQGNKPTSEAPIQQEDVKRQRAVAKKSTTSMPPQPLPSPQSIMPPDSIMSRVVVKYRVSTNGIDYHVTRSYDSQSHSIRWKTHRWKTHHLMPKHDDALRMSPDDFFESEGQYSSCGRGKYYTPKSAVKPYKMTPHTCSTKCKRTDVLPLKELRTYNPLARPILSGWERQILRFKGRKVVMYRAPCGRRLRDMPELHHYLRLTHSDMGVDLFDFNVNTHCLAEFVLNRCNVSKKDLSHGRENVPVPCVNYYDSSLPEFCLYNTERTPTAGVPLNLDPNFLCGCDCTDDCQDKSKCACWKITLEGARTIGLEGNDIGYVYKRLPEPLPSGIFECNSRCKCKSTCLNRVAQHPLQLKLQVFKTLKRGWGIRALNDIPKGAFLCVYAGNLLTDATANLDGLNEGDEYLAELDYIEVVEQMKEGYEEDVPNKDKQLDKNNGDGESDEEDEDMESSEDESNMKKQEDDDDFKPAYGMPVRFGQFNKHLRRRQKKEQQEIEQNKTVENDPNASDGCITISDDEEVREPSRFTAQAGMDDKDYSPKHRSVRSYFGKDEACYIMDAKVQGNIGRYLNHSCMPNVFVQNVFVDTHDPRFPWVAFFALSHVKAGTELTWNYNYDVGSVPGKVMYCYCGAFNCRGRLL